MSELIKDPAYRKFLTTPPLTPPVSRDKRMCQSKPWVVYVQMESGGPWAKKEFWKYSKAFKFFKYWVITKKCYDATINNKRIAFDPPGRLARIKGKYITGRDGVRRQATKWVTWTLPAALAADQPDHFWCRYCRRPVVFKYYSRHKRLGPVDPGVSRCCICGASERIAKLNSERRVG